MTALATHPMAASLVRASGGIVHRRHVLARGISPLQLRREVAAGALRQVRRDWFALPGCRDDLITAVELGTSVSCISALRARKIWTAISLIEHSWRDSENRLHVRAPAKSGHVVMGRSDITIHWSHPVRPQPVRCALDSLEDALAHCVRCQPFDFAVASCDSVLNQKLMTERQLKALAALVGGDFPRVAEASTGLADSGIESIPRVRLDRVGITMVPQVVVGGRRVDGVIGERLVIQADGFGPHSNRAQRNRDLKHDIYLRSLGYTVLRFSYEQIMFDWDWVLSQILEAVAKREHLW